MSNFWVTYNCRDIRLVTLYCVILSLISITWHYYHQFFKTLNWTLFTMAKLNPFFDLYVYLNIIQLLILKKNSVNSKVEWSCLLKVIISPLILSLWAFPRLLNFISLVQLLSWPHNWLWEEGSVDTWWQRVRLGWLVCGRDYCVTALL